MRGAMQSIVARAHSAMRSIVANVARTAHAEVST